MEIKMNTIKLRLEGNKVFAKSSKSESEIAFHKSGDLCAKGHEQLQDAKLFVVADPIWWLSDAAQSGEWEEYEIQMKVATNGKA